MIRQEFYEQARRKFSYLLFSEDCVVKFMRIRELKKPFNECDFDLFQDFILLQDLVEEVEP